MTDTDIQRLEYTVRELYDRVDAQDWDAVLDFLDDDVRMSAGEWKVGSKRVVNYLKNQSPRAKITDKLAGYVLSDFHAELMGPYFGVATFYVKCSYGTFPATVLASLFAGEWCVRLFSV
jgi:hypothetical protein